MDDLDVETKFLFIASSKVVIRLTEAGFDKKKYLTWCSEIWETVKINGEENLEETLNAYMHDEVENYIKNPRK